MPDVVFKNLGQYGGNINELLREWFGVGGIVRGSDFILQDSVVATMVSPDIFHLHPQIGLDDGKEEAIANKLYRQIPTDLKKYQRPPPPTIHLSGGYGLLSEVERVASLLTIAPEHEVSRLLRDEVIPLMRRSFNAKFVTGVSLDANKQQAWVTLTKMAMLTNRYGPHNLDRLLRSGSLDGVLPQSLDFESFFDTLTRFSPLLFTLPIRRMGCTWHFQCDAMCRLPAAAANGLIFEFTSAISPLAKEAHQFGLQGLSGMGESNIWRYLRFVVIGLNRLIRYLNDPRSFIGSDGSVDLLKKVQAYSAIHLIFADLSGVNFSTISHNRISYAMSALDKLANLRVWLAQPPAGMKSGEGAAMAELASQSQADEIKRVLGKTLRSMIYDELADIFAAVVDRCYRDIHAHLAAQSSAASTSEGERLDRLKSQRNLRHGTFLDRKQFEKLFLESDGTIPDTVATLPFLLVLALLADPAGFLAFRPAIIT